MNEGSIQKIVNGLKYMPASLGIKVLEKAHPIFKNYFSKVTAYGLDASKALDYVVNRFSNPSNYQKSLESRDPNQMTSSELISKNEIAASKMPGKALRNIASLATGISLPDFKDENQNQAASNASQSSQQPQPAKQPTAQQPQPAAQPAGQQPPPASGAANFIAQHSELGRYLDQLINQGIPPKQAAMQAKQVPKLQPMIDDVENNAQMPLEDLIDYLFNPAKSQKPSATPQKSTGGMVEALNILKQMRDEIRGRGKGV